MKEKVKAFFKSGSFFALLVFFMVVAAYGIYEYGTRVEAANGHVHDMSVICGQSGAEVTFTEWADSGSLPNTAGSYFLSSDVTLTATWMLPSGTTNLCLNGHQIKLEGTNSTAGSVMKMSAGAVLNLCDCSADEGGSITGGTGIGGRGGGIYMEQNAVLNMYGGQIKENNCLPQSVSAKGGGIYADSGEVHLYGGAVTGNTAVNGGGICAVSSQVIMHGDKALISENQSKYVAAGGTFGNGSGIYLEESSFCLEQGEITGNLAGVYGGGIYAEKNSEVQIKGGTISKNTAQGGAGIYAKGGKTLLLSGGDILENEAGSDGGGLYIYQNDITMSGGKISGNNCRGGIGCAGGGIEVMQGNFRMTGGEIRENFSEISGGGVYIHDAGSFIMTGGVIANNETVSRGGGILSSSNSTVSLSDNAKILDNKARYYGAGIYEENGAVTIMGGEISGNKVTDGSGVWFNGGAVYVNGGTFTLQGSPLIENNMKADTANNVYLHTDSKITIGGRLKGSVLTGVTMNVPGIFTSGWKDHMDGQNVEDFFAYDEDLYVAGLKEGEGVFGCRLTYVKPADVTGTVPESVIYPYAASVQIADNTLSKKGYKPVGWSDKEGGTSLYSSGTIMKSVTLWPVFSRNFTGKNGKLDLKAKEAMRPVDFNQFISFDEGVTEIDKNFRFSLSGESKLPEGLLLENGVLSGMPEKEGEFAFTVLAQDLFPHGQSRTFTITVAVEKAEKRPGTASVSQKNIYCGEHPAPVPVSETNGTEHVTYFYKLASEADAEYTKEVPTTKGEYKVRAVFAETDYYLETTATAQFTISHKYGSAWETDAASHWHTCACGAKDGKAGHEEDTGTITKEPSAEGPGEKTYKCSVCGFILRTEEIAYINEGKIEKKIEKGENVPDISVPISLKELAEIALTPEERESVGKGVDIKIILTIADAEKFIRNEDKEIAQAALNDFEKGQYLDISLFKQIDGIQNRIVKTNGKIRIVLEIPEHLRRDDTDKRTFAIIRVHDKKAVWLKDLDNNRETITFETDSFSTYVLVYQDEDKPDNGKPDDNKQIGRAHV